MRLIAEDIIEGVTIELYPYGKLKTTIDEIVNTMTQAVKNKEEVNAKIQDLEITPGDKYGLLVIGPKKVKATKSKKGSKNG